MTIRQQSEADRAAAIRAKNLANPRPPATREHVVNDIRAAPRREWSRDARIVAVRDFKWREISISAGDTLNWRSLGISELQLRGLWAACHVDCISINREGK